MHRTPVWTVSGIGVACVCAIVLLMGSGCNRQPETAAPATAATQPATASAASPATLPAAAVLRVNGHPIGFDSPRVMVERGDGGTRLLIYSEKENAAGSFYFEMPLEGEGLGEAPQEWQQRITQKQRADTLVGIESADRTLQPVELTITARPAGEGLVQITLRGRFLVYGPESEDAVGEARVEGEFVCSDGASGR